MADEYRKCDKPDCRRKVKEDAACSSARHPGLMLIGWHLSKIRELT